MQWSKEFLFLLSCLGLPPVFIVISNVCEKSPIIFFRFLVAMLHRNDKTLSFVIDELLAKGRAQRGLRIKSESMTLYNLAPVLLSTSF